MLNEPAKEDATRARPWHKVHGNSRSRRAQEAEEEGEMPLTRAIDCRLRLCK